MRSSPGASVKELLQVSVCPSTAATFQLTDAVVVLPLADTNDDRVPVAPGALFQCVAGCTPADSLAPITTVPVGAEAPFGSPPTKSILMIVGAGAPSVATSLVPPVSPVPGPSLPSRLGPSDPRVWAVSGATVPRSEGRFVSAENGTSAPRSLGEGASATAPASVATISPVPPVPIPAVPPIAAASVPITPPAPPVPVPAVPPVVTWLVPSAAVPPVIVPPLAVLPPEPPLPASGPIAEVPPTPPLAEAESAWRSPLPPSCGPDQRGVRFTQAAKRTATALAGGTSEWERAKFVIFQPVQRDIL